MAAPLGEAKHEDFLFPADRVNLHAVHDEAHVQAEAHNARDAQHDHHVHLAMEETTDTDVLQDQDPVHLEGEVSEEIHPVDLNAQAGVHQDIHDVQDILIPTPDHLMVGVDDTSHTLLAAITEDGIPDLKC